MEKINLNEMKLVFEENFDTPLKEGEWESSAYTERFYPVLFSFGKNKNIDGVECDKVSELVTSNISAENGCLIITGKGKDDETYTGSELRTKEFFNYGYFEIKAKIFSSSGICPAFWLVGSRDSDSGIEYEIDIFECFGRLPDRIKHTLLAHNYPDGSKGEYKGSEYKFIYDRINPEPTPENPINHAFDSTYMLGDWQNEWHTFGLDWKYDCITWYIDGEPVMTATPSKADKGQYVFNEPLRAILTCYSGRDVCTPMTGFPDETTDWENGNRLEVDYLKIWQY